MSSINSQDKLKWYDYLVVGIVSDITTGTIFAILSGAVGALIILPMILMSWLSYENFRRGINEDN